MTNTRIIPVVLLAALTTVGTSSGQYALPPYSQPGTTNLVPSVFPNGPNRQVGQVDSSAPPNSSSTALERVSQGPNPASSDPVGTLSTAQAPPSLPQGSYAPWIGDGPGCNGPIGRNGQIAYELYVQTGPSFLIGGGQFLDALKTGWSVGAGARTLFFNTANDAAWVLDLGFNYSYNRGSATDFQDLFIRQPSTTTTNAAGVTSNVAVADVLTTSRIRALDRTAFNYAIVAIGSSGAKATPEPSKAGIFARVHTSAGSGVPLTSM